MLWPTGSIRAPCRADDTDQPPGKVTARFTPSPTNKAGKQGPDGIVRCGLEEENLRCRVPAGRMDLRIDAEGYIPLHLWDVNVATGQESELDPMHLRIGAAVMGWVEDESQAPLAGVKVSLAPRTVGQHRSTAASNRIKSLELSTSSNNRGFFQIDGVSPGEYVVTAEKPPLAPAMATVKVLEKSTTRIADPPLVMRAPQKLEVYIDPPTTPDGIEWYVELTQLDGSRRAISTAANTRVSAAGSWVSPPVPQGSYRLTLGPESDIAWVVEEVELASTTPPFFVDVPVIEVRGKVWLGKDPLAANIWFGGESARVSVKLTSDEEGDFAGMLPRPGLWEVEVAGAQEPVRRRFQQVEVAREEGKSYAELELRVPNTRLDVTVVDPDQSPVERAVVTVQSLDEIVPAARKSTDSRGEISVFGLPAGAAVAVAEDTEPEQTRYSEEVRIDLAEDETTEITLVVRPEILLKGRVVAGSAGVPGARVKAEPCHMLGIPIFPETSDADGYFEVHLPASVRDYMINVAAPGFGMVFSRLVADPEQLLVIEVGQASGTVIVEAPEYYERGVWGAPMVYLLHQGAFEADGYLLPWSSFNGTQPINGNRLLFSSLAPGDYTACLTPPADREALLIGAPSGFPCASGSLSAGGELVLSLTDSSTSGG